MQSANLIHSRTPKPAAFLTVPATCRTRFTLSSASPEYLCSERTRSWSRSIRFTACRKMSSIGSSWSRKFWSFNPWKSDREGRTSTVDLRIKVACFVKKFINIFNLKMSWYKLVCTRRSIVLSLPLQWGFPALNNSFHRVFLLNILFCFFYNKSKDKHVYCVCGSHRNLNKISLV